MRMTGYRVGHGLMKPGQRHPVRRKIDLTVLRALAQQGERREQPARARVPGELSEKRLRADGLLNQYRQLFRIEKK